MSLRFLADESIPFVEQAFRAHGTVTTYTGPAIPPAPLADADVLLVRSATRVSDEMMARSRVWFVGAASAGTDHIDTAALHRREIAFASTPGSNAESVVEYVMTALLLLAVRSGTRLRGRTLGVIGCGNIGSRLVVRAHALGLRILKCDPFLAPAAPDEFVSLRCLLESSDIVTVHVPLTRGGRHPTYRLLDNDRLGLLQPRAWLLNTARGAVVDNAALLSCLQRGHIAESVLDVWEGEPSPSRHLVQAVSVATPHIAGHSYDGKVNGTVMLYNALLHHLDFPSLWNPRSVLAPEPGDQLRIRAPDQALDETAWLQAIAHQMYNLSADDARLRSLARRSAGVTASGFRDLRRNFPRRRSFRLHTLDPAGIPDGLRIPVEEALSIAVGA